MTRRALALIAFVLPSGVAWAAQVTHVATADSPDWPVEVDLTIGFQGSQESANISREEFKPTGGLIQATEMAYTRTTMLMPIRAAVGIWHDLELHVQVPVIIDDLQRWNFSSVSNASNVTVTRTPGVCPEGPVNSSGNCANNLPPSPLVNALPEQSDRGGFVVGDITLGAAWAALSEKDNDTDPTWVIGFDYTAPNASPMDPTQTSVGPGAPSQVAAIGDKMHHFSPWTALSKRHGPLDPYIEVYADIPRAAGGAYDNCNNPYPNSHGEARVNCNSGPWSQWQTQIQPVYVGGFWFGSEFIAFENVEEQQKVSIDLRFITEYHSEARTYTELSDLLGALTYQQDFARLGAQLGLYLRPSKYFEVLLNFGLTHDTDHWLTMENLGQPAAGQSTIQVGSPQQNPNFDFRFDNPGDRFLLQNSLIASFTGSLMFSF